MRADRARGEKAEDEIQALRSRIAELEAGVFKRDQALGCMIGMLDTVRRLAVGRDDATADDMGYPAAVSTMVERQVEVELLRSLAAAVQIWQRSVEVKLKHARGSRAEIDLEKALRAVERTLVIVQRRIRREIDGSEFGRGEISGIAAVIAVQADLLARYASR